MGLDIRKPIGLLFTIMAAELAAGGGGNAINLWCAAAFGAFGLIMLFLSRGPKNG